MTDFNVRGALFPQKPEDHKRRYKSYDSSKDYPSFEGVINIPADSAFAFAEYIMNGKPVGDRNEIPVAVNGWKKTSTKGKSYLSLVLEKHYKYEVNPDANDSTAGLDKAADALASATDGQVVEADPFDL